MSADTWTRRPSTAISLTTMFMMTSSNGNIFRVTGPLCGKFTGHRWIPHTKASDTELWSFLWSAPWINGWVNNREAGDLRRHRTHYDALFNVSFELVFVSLIKKNHRKGIWAMIFISRVGCDTSYINICWWFLSAHQLFNEKLKYTAIRSCFLKLSLCLRIRLYTYI